MTLFVFDFDGTLSDSANFICDTMQQAFIAHNIPAPTHSMIRHIIGITLEQAIYTLMPTLSDTDIACITQNYKNIFQARRSDNTMHDSLFDGSLDILNAIKTHHHIAGIATGKSLRGLNAELDRHNIRSFFIGYQTSDTHPSKPHPAMLHAMIDQAGCTAQDTIMIGDTSYDMQMAQSAGAMAIGVSWGCHDVDTLKKAGADTIIHHFSELNEFML
jgi:phosphoglycolate phosphatase